jgi:hypothetical protein
LCLGAKCISIAPAVKKGKCNGEWTGQGREGEMNNAKYLTNAERASIDAAARS